MGDSQRARRIPDAEWEVWRQELVRLYVEENASRREIIHIMANEHGFVITDTQLKHRFQKWDVKKYINDDDMTTMLALKRKRQALGKDIRFQYKGHDVEQERLERAYKRQRRQAASPTFIQPYIKVYISPNQSPQPASQAFVRGYSASQGPERQFNSHFHSRNMQASFLINPTNNSLEPSQGGYTHNFNEPGFIGVAQTSQDELMTNAALVPVDSYIGSEAVEGGFIYEPLSTEARSGLPLNQASDDIDTDQPTRIGSACSSGAWESLMNWSPSTAPSVLAMDERSSDRCSPPRTIVPSPSTNVMPVFRGVEGEGSSLTNRFHALSDNDQPMTCSDFDPSSALLPLLLMKAHLEHDFCSDPHLRIFSSGTDPPKVFNVIHSEGLRLELDNVVCWISESVSKDIRQRQARRRIGKAASPFEESRELSAHRRRSGDMIQSTDEVPIIGTSYAQSKSHKGVLRVILGNLLGKGTSAITLGALKISFIPKECRRTIGLCATFINVMSEFGGPRISPRLRTFNVVPDDSEVINCVKRNDLSGLQTLFDKREASPRDVNSGGFSLLSYAIYYGDCEIFRLLLEGGADTETCDSCTNSLDMMWTIWEIFTDVNVGDSFADFPSSIIRSVDQCISMSDAALHYGCNIDNSITYNPEFVNPLCHLISSAELPPQESETALRYLCNIGYDIEKRNSSGATFLLFAARQLCPSVVSVLRFLIGKGVDLHAVDSRNRGALHCAFEANSTYLSITGSSRQFDHGHEHWAREYFGTESNDYAGDYRDDSLTPAPSVIDDIRSDQLARDEDHEDHEACQECKECEDYENDDENGTEALEVPEGYVLCQDMDDHNVLRLIRDPLPILRTRLRFKLLTLLKAGCDPNLLDNYGYSPSDFAEYCGVWPEWTRALLNAGYVFDEDSDRWVKRVEDEISSGS